MNEVSNSDQTTIEKDTVVTFHYRLYDIDPDGSKGGLLETSEDSEPVAYLHGYNNIVRGLEKAMEGRSAGETFMVTVTPDAGYGFRDEDAFQRVPNKHVYEYKKGKTFRSGQLVTVHTDHGQRQAVVLKAGKFNVDLDFNHPFAGVTLYYEITVETVRLASQDELAHGHAHGPGGHHH